MDTTKRNDDLGLKPREVRLAPHNPEWKDAFERESKLISDLLIKEKILAEFAHIGSTAIPGLPAKPVVDILIGVSTAGDVLRVRDILKKSGKIYIPSISRFGQAFLVDSEGERFHYFITIKGSPKWNKYIGLRDFFSTNAARTAYAKLKEALASQFPRNRSRYTRSKAPFIEAIWKQISSRKRLAMVQNAVRSRLKPRTQYDRRPSVMPVKCAKLAVLGIAATRLEEELRKRNKKAVADSHSRRGELPEDTVRD